MDMKRLPSTSTALLLALFLVHCGSSDTPPADGTELGGNTGDAAVSGSGGAAGKGGSGGSVGTGGSTGTGGSSGTGGSTGTGGTSTPGVWEDVTPPAPKPWSDGSQFYYGFIWIDGAKADAPGTLYVGLDHQNDASSGIWKTTDVGNSWAMTPSQGPNDELRVCPQPVAVDPTDSNVVYAGNIKSGLGVFKSTDGGASWGTGSIIPAGDEPDAYWLSIDPVNHLHLIMTFHSAGKQWGGNAGVLESKDGGVAWTSIPAGGWTGAGQFAFFLGQKNDGTPDTTGSFWIFATQGNGVFRTENAGGAWSQVGAFNMTHGMEQLYRAPNGALYIGSVGKIYRSADNGKTWTDTGAQSTGDGYGAVMGDDTNIWAMLANTGGAAFGPYKWQTLPIGDTTSTAAASHWASFGTTTYADGPNRMVYDPINRIVYASNWGTGVLRYRLP
jgi:hypothetical protein